MAGGIHIGTSGWQYRHWLGTFYPQDIPRKTLFSYYSRHFSTVELNNPFYRLPPKENFLAWKKNSPPGFVFAVKANRFITHLKYLGDPEITTPAFFENISGLGRKLGPVLFQLPPSWKVNEDRLRAFLEFIPGRFRYAFEFRNPTWYTPAVFSLLEKHNCAFCIYELAGHTSPLKITSDFVYIRLHGPGGKYQGSYTRAALKKWATRCSKWSPGEAMFLCTSTTTRPDMLPRTRLHLKRSPDGEAIRRNHHRWRACGTQLRHGTWTLPQISVAFRRW
jgi:uncharacterized protein YecE (DUF72 family)